MAITGPGAAVQLVDGSGNPIGVTGNLLQVSGSGGGGGGAITAAAGSYSAGALVDGANVTEGTKADSAYAGSGSASIVAILKGCYAALVAATPAGTNSIGGIGCTTTGGATTYRAIGGAAATINASAIKGTAGQVYAYAFSNAQTTACYARIYNAATSTVGSGAPAWGPIAVPAGSTVTHTFDTGLVCGTGISATMTGGAVDTDTTTLTLAGNSISIAYK